MRVLVIDDHELVWGGMSLNIKSLTKTQKWPEMHCEGCPSVEKAVELAGQHFDLILLDYHLPGLSGLEGLSRILEVFESSPVVMCSADEDPRLVRKAIQSGAAGYLYKRMTGAQMQAALTC